MLSLILYFNDTLGSNAVFYRSLVLMIALLSLIAQSSDGWTSGKDDNVQEAATHQMPVWIWEGSNGWNWFRENAAWNWTSWNCE